MIVTVSPWGFEIEVHADIDRGEPRTWEHPGSEPYAVVERALVGGVDIYDMLATSQLLRLEESILRALDL
jgi:hypothetical protein